ncbi:MAG: PIN domain-containing protein, partial [Mycobacteriales bacterium]
PRTDRAPKNRSRPQEPIALPKPDRGPKKKGSETQAGTASYLDRQIGVAEASIVVLAERYRTRTIASLDHRHFESLRSLDGCYFQVLARVG